MVKQTNPTGKDLTLFDKIKNIFYFIGILGIGFVIIYCLAQVGLWTDKKEVEKIKESKSETVGNIIDVGYLKGSYAVAEYYVKDIRYERKDDSPADDIYKGEHYKIIYDSENPELSRIDYTRPIFLKDDKTKTTTAIAINRDWITVKFTYSVDGTEYNRFQKKPKDKKIKNGEIFNVEYLVSNPNIAILKIQ